MEAVEKDGPSKTGGEDSTLRKGPIAANILGYQPPRRPDAPGLRISKKYKYSIKPTVIPKGV